MAGGHRGPRDRSSRERSRAIGKLFNCHISPTLGTTKLRALRRIDVKALLNTKREQLIKPQKKKAPRPIQTSTVEAKNRPRKLSKSTVRLIRACLSVMLGGSRGRWLDRWEPSYPCPRASAERGKAAQVVLRARLRKTNSRRCSRRARQKDPEYFPLFLLLAARPGLRPGEAFRAGKWGGPRSIQAQESTSSAHFSAGIVGTTKTGTAREVDMSQELAVALSCALSRA